LVIDSLILIKNQGVEAGWAGGAGIVYPPASARNLDFT
jgi:hypothetical protein